jgi:hypothetical protein
MKVVKIKKAASKRPLMPSGLPQRVSPISVRNLVFLVPWTLFIIY